MTQEQNSPSSIEARTATGNELNGIIDFFKRQLVKQSQELTKYIGYRDNYHLPFAQNAIDHVTQHIEQTKAALADYEALLARYGQEGRA